jgi:outer membrane protein TolC
MRKMIILILLAAIAGSLASISLQESIERAIKNNLDLQAQRYSSKVAEWQQKQAFTTFLPKFNFNSNIVRIDKDSYQEAQEIYKIPVYDYSNSPIGYFPFSSTAMGQNIYKTTYNNSITASQPIFNGGKIILGYKNAKLNKEMNNLNKTQKIKDIKFQIAQTYFNFLRIKQLLEINQKSLAAARAHLQTTLSKKEVGLATQADVLQWQVKTQNYLSENNRLSGNLADVKHYWHLLLGTNQKLYPNKIELQNYDNLVAEYAKTEAGSLKKREAEFLQKVERTSPTLNILQINNKFQQNNLLQAKGNFLPSLNLQFSYELENDDEFDFQGDENWNLIANISLPIFHSGTNYSQLKQAEYQLSKTNKTNQYQKENYLVAARNTFNKLHTSAISIETQKKALELAEENYDISQNLYEQNMLTNSELLDAETMLYSSEFQLISSYYDFIIAKYEMEKFYDKMEEK